MVNWIERSTYSPEKNRLNLWISDGITISSHMHTRDEKSAASDKAMAYLKDCHDQDRLISS
jgi:hypothetical protein